MDTIVEISGLCKNYGEVKAVKGIDFSVRRGSLFAFLGVNGAGKSTTINILCSILKKDGGTVRINGKSLDAEADAIKPLIGIVFQNTVLDDRLTVKENLSARAGLYGIRGGAFRARLAELTEALDLKDILERPFGKLSGGQRRRADIARGLLNRPKLLFLDEPTTGLDPKSRKAVWDMIAGIKAETDMTVFLTTHYMEEADRADDVVIMDDGAIAARGTPNELKTKYSGDYLYLYTPRAPETENLLAAAGFTCVYDREFYKCKVPSCAAAAEFMAEQPRFAADFELIKGNMDDVFLNATGKNLEEAR